MGQLKEAGYDYFKSWTAEEILRIYEETTKPVLVGENEEIKMENIDKKTIKESIKKADEEMEYDKLLYSKGQYKTYLARLESINVKRADLDEKEKSLKEEYKEIVEVLEGDSKKK